MSAVWQRRPSANCVSGGVHWFGLRAAPLLATLGKGVVVEPAHGGFSWEQGTGRASLAQSRYVRGRRDGEEGFHYAHGA